MKKIAIIFLWVLLPFAALANQVEGVRMMHPNIELDNQESLQRGAKTYMTYCITCHSLAYTRYEQIAIGIGLADAKGKIDEKLAQDILSMNGAKLTDVVKSKMTKEQALQAYGIVPPDLTLEVRARGIDWIYTYLHDFYKDPTRPSGTNNLLFPDVAMPNFLAPFQGQQVPVYDTKTVVMDGIPEQVRVITRLELEQPGSMTPAQFDALTTDLVNFMAYVAEPIKLERYRIGVWVLLFLFIFLIVAYLLKKEFWRDIH